MMKAGERGSSAELCDSEGWFGGRYLMSAAPATRAYPTCMLAAAV
jgi:hypothetical protein